MAGTRYQLLLQKPCTHPPSDFRSQFPKSEVPAVASQGLSPLPSVSPISFLLSSPCKLYLGINSAESFL